ncbi:MAG: SGNH/GDSL hydrolase family protein [Bacteroidota bacterium]
MRVLSLGDSYTIGEGVAPEDRWPSQLARALRQRGIEVADPEIVAVTGWTTDELDAGIDAADPAGPYDLVTLLIGVNNQYRGYPLGAYRSEYRALLDRSVGFAGGDPSRVVAVSFPDWSVTPFAGRPPSEDAPAPHRQRVAAEVDVFNTAARQVAESAGVAWVDLAALSRTQGELVVDDGLHPDGTAYAAWVERIAPVAEGAIGGGA